MQAVFARLNKAKDARAAAADAKPPKDQCPYKHRPLCGVFPLLINEGQQPAPFPAPLPCTRVSLAATMDDDYVEFTQKMCYVWGGKEVPERGTATLMIPVSEFGKLEKFSCKVNGVVVNGDVLRRHHDDDDSFFWNARRPGANAEAAAKAKSSGSGGADAAAAAAGGSGAGSDKTSSTVNKKQSEHLHDVFYFAARYLPDQINHGGSGEPFKQGTLIEVEFVAKVGVLRDQKGKLHLLYPLTLNPKLSFQDFAITFTQSRSIRQILCLNKGPIVHTALRGRRGKAVVETMGERTFRPTDHLFGFSVELGEPIVPQCADPVAIFVLVTFVASMIFFTMTQNVLTDDF